MLCYLPLLECNASNTHNTTLTHKLRSHNTAEEPVTYGSHICQSLHAVIYNTVQEWRRHSFSFPKVGPFFTNLSGFFSVLWCLQIFPDVTNRVEKSINKRADSLWWRDKSYKQSPSGIISSSASSESQQRLPTVNKRSQMIMPGVFSCCSQMISENQEGFPGVLGESGQQDVVLSDFQEIQIG